MALKDMMRDAANAAQDAVSKSAQGVRDQGAIGVMQGLSGSYTELSVEAASQEYGMYLMSGERFTQCFALLRDKLLFTDKRIIFIDHQGATGQKVAVETINLSSVVSVKLETGGFGFDHAEIVFEYITSPYYKAYGAQTAFKKLEFPNGFNVQPLYCALEELAYSNVAALNA